MRPRRDKLRRRHRPMDEEPSVAGALVEGQSARGSATAGVSGSVAAAGAVKVPLFSAGRERTGDLELSAAVFGRTGHNSLLHEAVRMQLAKRRAGTASTKTKGLVAGGGKKPWRQKGTGRARSG